MRCDAKLQFSTYLRLLYISKNSSWETVSLDTDLHKSSAYVIPPCRFQAHYVVGFLRQGFDMYRVWMINRDLTAYWYAGNAFRAGELGTWFGEF